MAWRNASLCAEHLGIRKARFLLLVRAGKFPPPSYLLGERSPRWRLESLDSAMDGQPSTESVEERVRARLRKMEEGWAAQCAAKEARRAEKEARQGRG